MRTTDLYDTVGGRTRVSRAAHRAATTGYPDSVRRGRTGGAVPAGRGAATTPAAGWRGGHRRATGHHTLVGASALVGLGWLLAILAAPHVTLSPGGRMLALFCHLTSLVVGFGAVLTVDWFSLRWLLRREPLDAVLNAARAAHPLIWLGLVGLVVSGTALGPDTSSALVWVKLVAVLVVGVNGLFLGRVRDRLVAVQDDPRWSALLPGVAAALTSQLGWWAATLIGFLSANR
ncbi:hypothetical protein ACLQ25_05940 [Micromonospora sp. DT44]|uniref:hypothetical protein n=1 Tax=Micromonospora sp. DT44 TaxID=3393439 RepID=UPI003CF66440